MKYIFVLFGPQVPMGDAMGKLRKIAASFPSARMRAACQYLGSVQLGRNVDASDWPCSRPVDWATGEETITVVWDEFAAGPEYGPHPGDAVALIGCEDRYGYVERRKLIPLLRDEETGHWREAGDER